MEYYIISISSIIINEQTGKTTQNDLFFVTWCSFLSSILTDDINT